MRQMPKNSLELHTVELGYNDHGYDEQIICDLNYFLEFQWSFKDFN